MTNALDDLDLEDSDEDLDDFDDTPPIWSQPKAKQSTDDKEESKEAEDDASENENLKELDYVDEFTVSTNEAGKKVLKSP